MLSRHVAKTGDIKDFVITEEVGIAKGIRRIVAVTGQEAQDIGRLAQSLQERLDVLARSDRRTQDSGLKSFSVVRAVLVHRRLEDDSTISFHFFQELGQADISTLKKNELKKQLEVIRKAHDKKNKDREIELNKEVVYFIGRGIF